MIRALHLTVAGVCLLGVGLAATPPVAAQTTIDVAKISCKQFVLLQVADPDYLAVWLSGYYHGKRGNTVIDVQRLKDSAQKIKSYCLYNDASLMEAVEKLLASEK